MADSKMVDSKSCLLSEKFCEEFALILEERLSLTPNECFQKCIECMWKHKVCRKEDNLHCTLFMTHPKNRGGLMLSPHNAHRNGGKIHSGGADKSQLVNAYCIELSTAGSMRVKAIEANQNLIKRAGGLLAPVNGTERFLSLGCGHTVGWCKQIHVGGKTTQLNKKLALEDGTIDYQKVTKNPIMKEMVEIGWSWTVIPAEMDDKFPVFASIAQGALNIANNVSTQVGELETAVSLADLASDPSFQEVKGWQDAAVQSVTDTGVACASYAKAIMEFVEVHGGGPSAPTVRFMDSVAKQFHCTVSLGSVFWNALVNTVFFDKGRLFPLTRVCYALVNLTAPLEKDEPFAKLLTRGDLSKIASKALVAQADQCENVLNDAVQIADCLAKDGKGFEQFVQQLGQLFVRVGLLFTNQYKKHLEGNYYTLQQIQEMFLKAMSEAVGKPIKFPRWEENWASAGAKAKAKGKAAAPAQAEPQAVEPAASTVTLADHVDPIWIAQRAGFKVGVWILEKSVDAPQHIDRCFEIISIGSTVALKQASPYWANPMKTSFPLQELLSAWQVTKIEKPIKLDVHQQRSSTLEVELTKCMLFELILDSESTTAATKALTFWRKPEMVRTGDKKISAGQLQLSPIVPLSNISSKSSTSAISLGKHEVDEKDMEFFAIPLPKPSAEDDDPASVAKDATVAGFWWVSTTHSKAQANMAIEMKEVKGVEIPVLKNTRDLQPGTQLFKFVAHSTRASIVPLPGAKKKARKS